MTNNLPTQPVYDLAIHPRENELIVATHGRGFFIADVTALQGLTAEARAAEAALFDVQPVVKWEPRQRTTTASLNFNGESRPPGASIHYYLRSAAQGDVTIRIYEGARLIAETSAPRTAGLNAVRWTLQSSRVPTPEETAARGRGGRGRGGFGGGGFGRGGAGAGAQAPIFPTQTGANVVDDVMPGAYRVVLTVGGRSYEKSVQVLADPR
jgi:hypothetical protein